MQLSKKSYNNNRPERLKALENITFNGTKETHVENAGKGGFNLQESAVDINGRISDDEYAEDYNSVQTNNLNKAINLLSELKDSESDNNVTSFLNLLIKKIAVAKDLSYIDKFNLLIIKIKNTDIPDTNDLIKKLTKIFSRTIMLEQSDGKSKDDSARIAYVKVLNRAEQYLKSGKMIKNADVFQNPEIVAGHIKSIIDVLVSRFSQDAKVRAYPNIREKIKKLNIAEISSKRTPGGSAIGVAITLIKNILNGRDSSFINLVIDNLSRIL